MSGGAGSRPPDVTVRAFPFAPVHLANLANVANDATDGKPSVALRVATVQDDLVPLPMSSDDIAADLTARIRAGEYPPGSQLPTYAALAALYSVSESTISSVMRLLRERRIVVGVVGRGTFVPE